MTTQITITNTDNSENRVHITELHRVFDEIGDEDDIEGIFYILKPGYSVTISIWDGLSLSVHEIGTVEQAKSTDDGA